MNGPRQRNFEKELLSDHLSLKRIVGALKLKSRKVCGPREPVHLPVHLPVHEPVQKTGITLYFRLFYKIVYFIRFDIFCGRNIILNDNFWLKIWVYELNLIVLIQKFQFLTFSGYFSTTGGKFWIPVWTWNLVIFECQKLGKNRKFWNSKSGKYLTLCA